MTLELNSNIMNEEGGDILRYTLKELRARKDETQEDVAEALGISVQTYSAWEQDVSNVGIYKVKALADHFGVAISEIFFEKQLELNSKKDSESCSE